MAYHFVGTRQLKSSGAVGVGLLDLGNLFQEAGREERAREGEQVEGNEEDLVEGATQEKNRL